MKRIRRIIIVVAVLVLMYCIYLFRNSDFYCDMQYERHKDDLISLEIDMKKLTVGDRLNEYEGRDSSNTWSTEYTYYYGFDSIQTVMYSQRIWLNEKHDYYDFTNFFYNDEIIKQVYTFPRPINLIKVYENLAKIYGVPENDTVIREELKDCMYSAADNNVAYASKDSPVPYIELCKWEEDNSFVLLRRTDFNNRRNPDELEIVFEIKQSKLQEMIEIMNKE